MVLTATVWLAVPAAGAPVRSRSLEEAVPKSVAHFKRSPPTKKVAPPKYGQSAHTIVQDSLIVALMSN